jgi:putative glutamine amidotransferase
VSGTGRRPLIALTTEAVARAGRHGRPQALIYGAYIARLQEVGLTPVLITPLHDEAAVRQLVGACAGLVLSGGEDVDPARYGEEALPERCFITPERDAAEFAALDVAAESQLPVLAICRGIQILNVHRGGTLWQDLPSQRPAGLPHEQVQPYGEPAHSVSVAGGTRLRTILGAGEVHVNSYHHQAPKDIAPGLLVSAVGGDGVIEGLEAVGGEWVVGVQWHPERLPEGAAADHPDRRLFHAFAQAVDARFAALQP